MIRRIAAILALLCCLLVGALPALRTHQTARAATLPVPNNLAAQPDDRAAVLTWNADVTPSGSDPAGVHGYKVTWGPQGTPSQFTALSMYRIIEAQPLVNGQPYVASVQAIDNDGNLSAPSAPITFTGDSSRVDALRTQMTGYFDDFNDPALSMLAPDARKWNTAVSYCNDNPVLQGMFLNDQSHAHNLASDSNCDRGVSASRPRAVFDFTGRTGTITFDLDGTQRRDFWYLDLVPSLMDIDGEAQLDGGPGGGTANMLRFQQNGQGATALYYDNTGTGTELANTAPNHFDGKVAWDNLTLIPNVRRHWTIHVSQHHIDIFINGVEEYANDTVNLPFSKAYLIWALFSYNTHKANEDRALMHWDNFGFDGPAPSQLTHNYLGAGCCQGGDFTYLTSGNQTTTKSVTVPDSLVGETAERLMFQLEMPANQTYQWSATDSATVNGHVCPIAQPGPSTIPQTQLVSTLSPYQVICTLPLGTLHTGSNTVAFNLNNAGIINVHAEVDFPIGSEPAYTQPGLPGMPMSLPDIGPGATIDQLGTCSDASCYTWTFPHGPFTVKGVVPITFNVQEEIALIGNGKIPGIREVQVTVDGQVVLDRLVHGAPAVSDTYPLDTTQFSNGTHQLRLLAWSVNGTAGIPDYADGDATEGTDWPIALTVANAGGATGTRTPTRTPTPVPPTATATGTRPAATATPTAAPPTATPAPGGTLGYPVSTGGGLDGGSNNNISAVKVQTGPTPATVSSLSAYVGAIDPGNRAYGLAIYTDSAGHPGTLVASASGTLAPAAGWNTLPLGAALAANSAYWLAYNTATASATANELYYVNGAAGIGAYSPTVPCCTFPPTQGGWSTGPWQFSLYATIAAPPTPTATITSTATPAPPTNTATSTSTPTNTATAIPTSTATPTPTGTDTPTSTAAATSTNTATNTATDTPTATPTTTPVPIANLPCTVQLVPGGPFLSGTCSGTFAG